MADLVVKQGFLVKKGHVRHNWRTRWFVLSDQDLRYYRNREDKNPAGVIALAGATLTCPTLDDCKKPWMIQIKIGDGREYWIQAPDLTIRDEWITAIEDVVRKLARLTLSPERAATVKLTGISAAASKREVVQAMQDRSGGIKLNEFKCKGARQTTKYFSGKEVLDWLITWSFCSTRQEALKFASSVLRHRFFHPVRIDFDKGQCINLKDDQTLGRELLDTEDAYYVFVCFAPGEEITLGDCDDESDSESDDDLLSASRISSAVDVGNGKILKQGFLQKKGHLRHNWKPRLFVLREKQEYIYFYRGSKQMSKPLGAIPLKDLSVLALDNEGESSSDLTANGALQPSSNGTTEPAPALKKRISKPKLKVNRILLTTATGARYTLEAASSDDRDSWVSQLNIASKIISH